jgi:protocatechuate 3,4-dioxygenase beta subunit
MTMDAIYRPPVWREAPVTLDRRRLLANVAAGAVGVFASTRGFAQAPRACMPTPDSGEGPFYFDPDLVRVDITEDVPGAPLDVAVQIVRAGDCATLDGARVDLWHADAIGLYSGYARQPGTGDPSYSVEGKTFLRGTQFTDSGGSARFRTIYPSWYGGRTPHIHFKVFLGDDEVIASQLFFPDEFNNEVFAEWDPYRQRSDRRRTFNEGDTFLRDSVEGAFCEMERTSSGYRGNAVVVVAPRAA